MFAGLGHFRSEILAIVWCWKAQWLVSNNAPFCRYVSEWLMQLHQMCKMQFEIYQEGVFV